MSMYNPGTLLSSVIDTILNPGTYYLKIEGKGNIYAPSYASLGSYALKGRFYFYQHATSSEEIWNYMAH